MSSKSVSTQSDDSESLHTMQEPQPSNNEPQSCNTVSKPADEKSALILGAYVIGMIDSFDRTYILDIDELPFDTKSLKPDEWYPFDYAHKILNLVGSTLKDSSNLLFWAGVKFMEIWYWEGPGRDILFSSLDWVMSQKDGKIYKTVVSGPVEITGSENLIELNLEEGYALVEDVMPWGPDYLRGIHYGGFLLFDDLAYFNSEVVSVTEEDSQALPKIIIKMTFREKNVNVPDHLIHDVLDNKDSISEEEKEELIWRFKHRVNLNTLREAYITDMEALLKKSIGDLRTVQKQLMHSNAQLSLEATTDPLTSLHNKRYFYQHAEKMRMFAKRHDHSLSVILIDIDYFKRFNDHYGHLEGDKAIKQVAICLESIFKRGEEIVARFGGEEFVCVCIDMKPNNLAQLIKRLQATLHGKKIPHEKSQASEYLTISIGSSTCESADTPLDTMLEQADKALYKAKGQGRNCHVHLE